MTFAPRRSLYVDADLLTQAIRASTPAASSGRSGLLVATVVVTVLTAASVFVLLVRLKAPVWLVGVTMPAIVFGLGALGGRLAARQPPVRCDRLIVQGMLDLDDDDMDLVMMAFHLVMADPDSRHWAHWAEPIARSMHRVLARGAHVSEHPRGGC